MSGKVHGHRASSEWRPGIHPLKVIIGKGPGLRLQALLPGRVLLRSGNCGQGQALKLESGATLLWDLPSER